MIKAALTSLIQNEEQCISVSFRCPGQAIRKMNVKLLMLYGSRECITYLFCCCNRVPQPKQLRKKAFNWACGSLGLESMTVELRYGDRNS